MNQRTGRATGGEPRDVVKQRGVREDFAERTGWTTRAFSNGGVFVLAPLSPAKAARSAVQAWVFEVPGAFGNARRQRVSASQ